MLDKICEELEREALDKGHDIGLGFYEALMLGKVPMLRMDCRKCDFFAVVEPSSYRCLKSGEGSCDG